MEYTGNNPEGISGQAFELSLSWERKLNTFTVETADGQTISHPAGSTVELAGGIGTLQIHADGTFNFVPKNGYTGNVPPITLNATANYIGDNTYSFPVENKLLLSQQPSVPDGSNSVLSATRQWYFEEPVYRGWKYLETGNVLDRASSKLNGNPFGKLEITEFTVNGKTYQAGDTAAPFSSEETFTLQRDGTFIYYTLGENAHVWTIGYTFSNGSKSGKSTMYMGSYELRDDDNVHPDYDLYDSLDSDQPKPSFPDADENIQVTGQHTSGMLLERSAAYWGMPDDVNYHYFFHKYSQLTGFSINGLHYKAGDVAAIYGLGTFTVNSNGYYHLNIEGQQVAGTKMPEVHYTLEMYTDSGTKTDTSVARFNLADGISATACTYKEANSQADGKVKINQTHVLEHQMEKGNLFADYDAADKPYIAGFRIGNSYYAANQTVEIANVGLFTLNRDGSYYVDARELPNPKRGWSIPEIAFTVSNGSKASSSSLFLQAGEKLKNAEQETLIDSDPLTYSQ